MALFYDMELTGQLLFTGFGIALLIDACIGISVLHKIFSTTK